MRGREGEEEEEKKDEEEVSDEEEEEEVREREELGSPFRKCPFCSLFCFGRVMRVLEFVGGGSSGGGGGGEAGAVMVMWG